MGVTLGVEPLPGAPRPTRRQPSPGVDAALHRREFVQGESTTVASPPQGQMRPSRYLFTLAAIFVVLFGVVIGFGSGSLKDRLKPHLGLDLIGGTTMTLTAQTADGKPPSAGNLATARDIIQKRVDAFGVSEALVETEGNNNIVISV